MLSFGQGRMRLSTEKLWWVRGKRLASVGASKLIPSLLETHSAQTEIVSGRATPPNSATQRDSLSQRDHSINKMHPSKRCIQARLMVCIHTRGLARVNGYPNNFTNPLKKTKMLLIEVRLECVY